MKTKLKKSYLHIKKQKIKINKSQQVVFITKKKKKNKLKTFKEFLIFKTISYC